MTDDAQTRFMERIAAHRRSDPVVVPHYIGGEERFDGRLIEREDPSVPGTIVTGCHGAPKALVLDAIAASRAAQRKWSRFPLAERILHIRKAVPIIESRIEDWALRLAVEVGKPYAAARAESSEVLDLLRQYSDCASFSGVLVNERATDPSGLLVDSALKPYGVFGAMASCNYPIMQAAGPVVGGILAGNGVVVKTSHYGPWSGQAVKELVEAMDLPIGLVNVVHGADDTGRDLVASDIDGLTFSSSASTGQAILRDFAKGPHIRPVIAEMGGINTVIVAETGDLERAADGIVFSAFDLSGQGSSALSRVIVTPGSHALLVKLIADRVKKLQMDDPIRPDAFGGPVVDLDAFERHATLVGEARTEGFSVITGSTGDSGYFVPAVVIDGVPADHDLATAEHFLPFLTISEVEDFEAALKAANSVTMGLTAGIYTGDRREAEQFVDSMEVGFVNVNVPGHATTGWRPCTQTFGGSRGSRAAGNRDPGRWYFQLFGREQARRVPSELSSLLIY